VHGDNYMHTGSPWTDKSLVLRVSLGKDGYVSHEIIPVRIEEGGRPAVMPPETAQAFRERHQRISADLADPEALERAWLETARRYVRINVEWLTEALRNKGMDYASNEFMQRLFYDENLPWLGRAIEDLIGQLPPRAWDA
jgi:hypothetical protein